MWPNPQFPTDFVTFNEEILNGKHFLYSIAPLVINDKYKKLIKIAAGCGPIFSEFG